MKLTQSILTEAVRQKFWARVPSRPAGACWEWSGTRNECGYGRLEVSRRNPRITLLAHRVSYVVHFGDVPDGLCVMHSCDNPGCVNPAHLSVGTWADNNHDRDRKGRQVARSGDANGTRLHPESLLRGDEWRAAHLGSLPRGDDHPLRKRPELAARGDRHGSVTKPESVARGDRNGMRVHPESVLRGSSHPNAKLTDDQVRELRARRAAGETLNSLAAAFGITFGAVSGVATRRTYRNVS